MEAFTQDKLQQILPYQREDMPVIVGAYGVMYEDHMTDYYIGIFSKVKEVSDLESLTVPALTWAIFEITGPLPASMAAMWERIHTEWFTTVSYEYDIGPEIEWYSSGDMQSDDYYSEVWIPIIKKG